MFSYTKALLDEFDRIGIPGTDISVFHKGREVFREMRGISDENGTPVNGTERYNIYSCSKPITVTAAMMLAQEGKLRLEDELALYLPAFSDMRVKKGGTIEKAQNPITVFHLFKKL